jgi:hypothetical protein
MFGEALQSVEKHSGACLGKSQRILQALRPGRDMPNGDRKVSGRDVSNGQPEIVAVKGSLGRQGPKHTARKPKPANNSSLTL